METDQQEHQSISIDIQNFRPSYDLTESDDEYGCDETFAVMIRGTATLDIPEADDLVVFQVMGSRLRGEDCARSDEGSMLGIGQVKSMKDGLFIEVTMPFDAALKVSGCLETGAIGKAMVECDPIKAVGDWSYLRRVKFVPA